jgi:DNA-binding Lrp family transcriptional regulator
VWNVQATFAYRTNQDLYDIKNDLTSRYRDLILDIQLTAVVGVYVHEKSFLINQSSTFTSFIDSTEHNELDDVSERILVLLFHDARINLATIAAKAKTTVDVVRNRIKRMEDQRIIVRYAAILNYAEIGYDIYKALIYLKSSSKEEIGRILAYAEGSDKIIHLVKQIAPWDIELIIFAENFTEYNRFIGQFTERFAQQTRKVETAIMGEDIVLPAKHLIFE